MKFFVDMDANPWNVDNLDVFLYYWCPECSEKWDSKPKFIHHALSSHPKVCNFLNENYIHLIIKNSPYLFFCPHRPKITFQLYQLKMILIMISLKIQKPKLKMNLAMVK